VIDQCGGRVDRHTVSGTGCTAELVQPRGPGSALGEPLIHTLDASRMTAELHLRSATLINWVTSPTQTICRVKYYQHARYRRY
jgi:hypothetical protein